MSLVFTHIVFQYLFGSFFKYFMVCYFFLRTITAFYFCFLLNFLCKLFFILILLLSYAYWLLFYYLFFNQIFLIFYSFQSLFSFILFAMEIVLIGLLLCNGLDVGCLLFGDFWTRSKKCVNVNYVFKETPLSLWFWFLCR